MSRDLQTYGITTFNQAIGASQVVSFGGDQSILDTVILGVTGGVLCMSGVSTAISGSVIAAGCEVRSTPTSVGAAKIFLAGSGGVTAQILQKLGQGYA